MYPVIILLTRRLFFLVQAKMCSNLSWFTSITSITAGVNMKRKDSFANLHLISMLQDVGITLCFRLQQTKALAGKFKTLEGHKLYFMHTTYNPAVQPGLTNVGNCLIMVGISL